MQHLKVSIQIVTCASIKPSNYVTFVALTPAFLIKPGRNIMIVATSISFRGPSRFTTAPMFNIMQSVSITSVQ